MILIISDQMDGHVPPVAAELSRRGEEFRVFDPATYPNAATVTVEGSTKNFRAILNWDDQELDLARVKTVWYRRPGDFALSDRLLPAEDTWIRNECNHCFRALWEETRSLWISPPHAIRRASLKLTQLRTAAEMGFQVPQFIITNDDKLASNFIDLFANGVIVKVLTTPVIVSDQKAAILYTHLVTTEDRGHISSVRFGPTFLQQFVTKAMDVRVTVFGDQAYAVGIQSTKTEDGRIDFRRAEICDLPHLILTLPERLNRLCIDLVSKLGLKFGAIDLILTPEGEYFFLEINPNGQWYWLEWITGIPLTKNLCDLLSR